MPAIINLAANLILGSSLVLSLKRSPALRGGFVNWYLVLLLAFEAVIFTPIATFLFRFYPHWSLLYAFDPRIFPNLDNALGWLSLAAIILNFGGVISGYAVTRFGWLTGQIWLWPLPLGVGILTLIITLIGYGDRLFWISDYDTFWRGDGKFILLSLAGWLGLLLYASLFGFVRWAYRHFKNHDPEPLGIA